mmetsp:Transcript_15391/g.48467  ORF Transcript_15391/g.48467 Transcript_15391/m.48467 type:complete len:279 (-) Transcript_15391:125-961(-)
MATGGPAGRTPSRPWLCPSSWTTPCSGRGSCPLLGMPPRSSSPRGIARSRRERSSPRSWCTAPPSGPATTPPHGWGRGRQGHAGAPWATWTSMRRPFWQRGRWRRSPSPRTCSSSTSGTCPGPRAGARSWSCRPGAGAVPGARVAREPPEPAPSPQPTACWCGGRATWTMGGGTWTRRAPSQGAGPAPLCAAATTGARPCTSSRHPSSHPEDLGWRRAKTPRPIACPYRTTTTTSGLPPWEGGGAPPPLTGRTAPAGCTGRGVASASGCTTTAATWRR